MDAIVPITDLPFTWTKLGLDDEDDLNDIELVHAWVVDVPDPTSIAPLLKWLKQAGLDHNPALAHLKRVRRQGPHATLLLDTDAGPPSLPSSPHLPPAYQLPVPTHPARTPAALALKNARWPTVLCPHRKWEPEPWTRARVVWAQDAVARLKRAYAAARQTTHEIPVVAHVPVPLADGPLARPFFGHDTRVSTHHPLRHAVLDLVQQIAADRAHTGADAHGAQYLLTGLSLFITHEPCVMCAMALLHSRVKEVFYLRPMPRTGGCGGLACVPALKGVNHRFTIAVWHLDDDDDDGPDLLDQGVDV